MLSRPGSDLDTRYWKYSMEWQTGEDGYLKWYYDNVFVWGMDASSFGAYTVCEERAGVGKECHRTPERMIPNEPMSLVMNTAIGTWNGGQKGLDNKHWPAKFYVDHVRVWQKEANIGCDPPDFPTKTHIEKNAWMYGEPVTPSGYDTPRAPRSTRRRRTPTRPPSRRARPPSAPRPRRSRPLVLPR